MYSYSSPIYRNRFCYRSGFAKNNFNSSNESTQDDAVKSILSTGSNNTAPTRQAKLNIGQANDPLEKQADQVADAVVSGNNQSSIEEHSQPTPHVQRKCEDCEEELQRKPKNNDSPSSITGPTDSAKSLGSGHALPETHKQFFENSMGQDFSQVRIHTDDNASAAAESINAKAYTQGTHIVFNEGQYNPDAQSGKRLLAHELTHVVQQSHYGQLNQIQRDLARPPNPARQAPLVQLTPQQIQDAITFNDSRIDDPYTFTVIRDIVGLAQYPAESNEELVNAIVGWQAERGMTQDGKIGHTTTRSLFLEMVAERVYRDAILLLLDSYSLPNSSRLNDVLISGGAGACNVNGSPSDATVSGGKCPPRAGRGINLTVCRTSIPRNFANYTHFIRIIGHELVHVIYCASGGAYNVNETEFDAYVWEACASSRAPNLPDSQRVGHANIALAHYNLMPLASRTAARIAMRGRLQALIAAGGAGRC